MKALSVLNPWAWAIVHGGKNIENRSWHTPYRGTLLIHAGCSPRAMEAVPADLWRARYGVRFPQSEELSWGGLIGTVELVDCVRADWVLPEKLIVPGHPDSVWAEGPWCWVLRDPRPFDVPIPHRGRQRLFDVPDDLITL